jgi:hypothetical protein
MALSRLGRQIAEIAAALTALDERFALIGGLGLAAHKVVRATQDVDLLIAAESADRVDVELARLGYRCRHRSANSANYERADERLNFLYASRPIARRLLAAAPQIETSLGRLRVVSAEGIIAFKIQAFVSDPRRTRDLDDIRALLEANRASLDIDELRGYFRLFDRETLLDELLREID